MQVSMNQNEPSAIGKVGLGLVSYSGSQLDPNGYIGTLFSSINKRGSMRPKAEFIGKKRFLGLEDA